LSSRIPVGWWIAQLSSGSCAVNNIMEDAMGKTMRGNRDGTGPKKGSYQDKMGGKGRRQMAGEKCPVKGKKK
jgi:hypothetical protein